MFKTTLQHIKYWRNRKIDWKQAYFDTWDHPHRKLIIEKLRKIRFGSLLEYGCASGPNLFLINKTFPQVQLGGMDISRDAINTAKQLMPFIVNLEVTDGKTLFWSDKSSDVLLTDMCLIYVSPFRIKRLLREIARVTRNQVIFVEFHAETFLKQLLSASAGYYAHDYRKLLSEAGFFDINIEKIKEKDWPGGQPQKDFAYVITARI